MKNGRRTAVFEKVRKELEPVEKKIPQAFKKEEWDLLSYEEKLKFVRDKKDAVLNALDRRLSSPIASLVVDLVDLEARMESQNVKDLEKDSPLSKEYMKALALKIELAKALKKLTDKGVVRHEHVIKRIDEDEVLDFVIGEFEEEQETNGGEQ